MQDIESELDVLITKEGGYSNDPNDAGGETIWGVTKAVAVQFGYTKDMASMSKDEAKAIYRAQYWVKPKFDKVFEIYPDVAFELFDTGVNAGTGIAAKFLQRALNVLNQDGTLYPDMVVDGGIGSATLDALKAYAAKRKSEGGVVLMRMLNALQCVKYIEIAEGKRTQESFLYGWILNRVA